MASSERPAPTRPARPEKLTLADIQVDRVAGKKRRDDVPKLDPVFRVAQTCFGPLQIDIPADHEPDHIVMIDFRLLELSRVLSIPETDNAIGAGIDLHQAMRNIDHADSGALQFSNQMKEAICLRERQGGSRLVHDDYAGIGRERLGNFDKLLLGD